MNKSVKEATGPAFASRLNGYPAALLALVAVMALNYLSINLFGQLTIPFFFFAYLVVFLFGAWIGYGPGIVVSLAIVIGVPFAFRPGFTVANLNPWAIAMVLLVSLAISSTAAGRKQTERVLRNANRELDARVREQTQQLKIANTVLRQQLAELETLYRKLFVGLGFLDDELRFIRTNEKLAALGGASTAEHVGRTFRQMAGDQMADLVEPLCRRVRESGEPVIDHEVCGSWRGEPGIDQDWSIGCSAVKTEDGQLIGLQIIVQDIGERKRAEQALKQANSDLERFAFSASHDLQEPLRMVAIYSQMIQKKFSGKLGPEGEQYIAYAVQGAMRMKQLVSDLLAYTQASSLTMNSVIVDANEAFEKALLSLSAAVAESKATVTCGPLPLVQIHPAPLQQMFQNLIGNALKYRSELPPQISVAAEQRGTHWVFSIRDNGIGIDPQYKEQVFGIFKRLHTSAEYSGTGIGLAICQRIAERHGGRIWLESELGKGSVFFFSLPHIRESRSVDA